MRKSLVSILLLGSISFFTASASIAATPDQQCMLDLMQKEMGSQYNIGFTNYTSASANDYAGVYIFANDGNPTGTLYGKCAPGILGSPQCQTQGGLTSITCSKSSDGSYNVAFQAANGNAKFTIKDKNVVNGTLLIQYGTLISYPAPYKTCNMDDDDYCDFN